MDKFPLFTIAIPTYNRIAFLKKAVESAQKQDYPNFEIVVFDNHSTDGTFEYLKQTIELDKRIRFIRNPENMGGIKNIEQIPAAISGKYVLILCDDDCIEPALCSNAVETFYRYPSLTLWFAKTNIFFGHSIYDSKQKGMVNVTSPIYGLLTGDEFIKRACLLKVAYTFPATVYLVEALRKAGGFSCGSSSADMAATLSTASFGDVYLSTQNLTHLRTHESNDSNGLNDAQPLLEMERSLKAYEQLRKNTGEKYQYYYLWNILFVTLAKIASLADLRHLPLILSKLQAEGFKKKSIIFRMACLFPKMFLRIILGPRFKQRLILKLKKYLSK
jgi:glycosyltransferase involved in cell wall biosynthesis